MLIALDYDGTFTADPELWNATIKDAQKRGHKVFIVTMRYPTEGPIASNADQVIYTSRKAKRPYMEELGHSVQIWIDDQPDFILYGAAS